MSQIYAIYDPANDKIMGIYGTNKTVDDERRKMLATFGSPGEFWHKEAQAHPDSWHTPASLNFVMLDSFSERSDRNRLVKEWRSSRFAEARSIAKSQTAQTIAEASAKTEYSDPADLSFVESVERWAELTASLFSGDSHDWIRTASDADRKRVKRLLERKVGNSKTCDIAERIYNALNNYENFPEMFSTPDHVTAADEIPF